MDTIRNRLLEKLNLMYNYITAYLSKRNDRSVKALINIFYSFIVKGGSIFVQFALVPLTINYLDKYQYGIWLTMASIFAWFSFFDVGIGHGLRNKLAEALALNNFNLAKIYISTAYAVVSIIFISMIAIFWFINPFLNWNNILNVPNTTDTNLGTLTFVVFSFFSLRFIFGLIGNILYADQKPALNNAISSIGNVLALLIIWILTNTTEGSLFWVGIVYAGCPLVIFVFFTIFLFATKYRLIAPSYRFVKIKFLNQLLGVGLQFFIIQISVIILFATSNILITQFYGPEEVTAYNIAFKYFNAIIMIFGIIMSPFWSAITEAYIKDDINWIRTTLQKLNKIAILLVFIVVVMYFSSDFIYRIWIGSEVNIAKSVSLLMAIQVIVSILYLPANIFINGISKIRMQLYLAMCSITITIPLAFIFCKILDFGPSGVILATICSTLPTGIILRIQTHKIICGKAKGVWFR